jgi:uncharacterized membrane protein YoaK (UPF0700 family)
MLLAVAGGSLDSFLYLNHGHVFAGAMTGDAVLFGIALLGGKWGEALHAFLPLGAFLVGVWIAFSVENHLQHHAATVSLLCEAAVLFAASWLPGGFPDLVFVPAIALVAAFQVVSFRKVDRFSYYSTFITGNLRTMVEGLYKSLTPEHRAEGMRKFRDLGLVIASFFAGAVLAAVLARRTGNHALWLTVVALLIVLGLVLARYRRGDFGERSRDTGYQPG